MGVKKSMQTFFEAMEGNNLPRTGGKIINTPMGPFTWDNLQESWVNVNNGFRLPNMTVQELMMFGYDPSIDGGKDTTAPAFVCTEEFTTTIGTQTRSINVSSPGNYIIINSAFTIQTASCAPILQISLIETPVSGGAAISFNSVYDNGNGPQFLYSLDGTPASIQILDSTNIQLTSNVLEFFSSFKMRLNVPSGGLGILPSEFNVIIKNISANPDQTIAIYQIRVP